MAASRHLKGTVFSRMRDLLKSGVIKEKPIWYDVVAAFPPPVEADLDREPVKGNVNRIVYPEDSVRRRFFEEYESAAVSLHPLSTETLSDRFVEKCMEFMNENDSESHAYEKTVKLFMNELQPKQTSTSSKSHSKSRTRDDSRTIYDFLNLEVSESVKDE